MNLTVPSNDVRFSVTILLYHVSTVLLFQFSVAYIRNNFQFLSFTLVFALIQVVLVGTRLSEYWEFKNADGSRNWAIIIARAFGEEFVV